jgi:ubiquinone/menaquinone biosynthesis C-methylase UbiE
MTDNKYVSGIDIDYFSQFTEGYAPYTEADLDLMVGSLVDIVRKVTAPRICEVGSASGQFSVELERRLQKEDVSFFGLDIARKVLTFYPFHKICGSAFQMPVSDKAFNIVCYPASLHHLAPFPDAIAEMSRVLASGGYMYCVEPNFFHPQRRCFMRFQRLYRLCRNANDVPINPYELEALLQSHGMRVVAMRYINITFREPGILQRTQNFVANLDIPSFLDKFILPWFIMVAVKDGD